MLTCSLLSLTTVVDLDEKHGNEALLKHHGPKITSLFIAEATPLLVLDLCPNIKTLTILSHMQYAITHKRPEDKASLQYFLSQQF